MGKIGHVISKEIILVCCVFMQFFLSVNAQEGRHIVKQGFTLDFFKANIQEPSAWIPYPAINRSEEWKSVLPPQQFATLIQQAEGLLGYQWPIARASVFLDFAENGNRTNF